MATDFWLQINYFTAQIFIAEISAAINTVHKDEVFTPVVTYYSEYIISTKHLVLDMQSVLFTLFIGCGKYSYLQTKT